VAKPLRRVTASHPDQVLLDVSFDLDFVWSRRLGPMVEGLLESFGYEAFAYPFDRSQADAKCGDNVLVGVAFAPGGISQKQDPGMGKLARRPLAS
jgi:hypothetical protein